MVCSIFLGVLEKERNPVPTITTDLGEISQKFPVLSELVDDLSRWRIQVCEVSAAGLGAQAGHVFCASGGTSSRVFLLSADNTSVLTQAVGGCVHSGGRSSLLPDGSPVLSWAEARFAEEQGTPNRYPGGFEFHPLGLLPYPAALYPSSFIDSENAAIALSRLPAGSNPGAIVQVERYCFEGVSEEGRCIRIWIPRFGETLQQASARLWSLDCWDRAEILARFPAITALAPYFGPDWKVCVRPLTAENLNSEGVLGGSKRSSYDNLEDASWRQSCFFPLYSSVGETTLKAIVRVSQERVDGGPGVGPLYSKSVTVLIPDSEKTAQQLVAANDWISS